MCVLFQNGKYPDQLAAVQYPHLHPTDHQTENQKFTKCELIRAYALDALDGLKTLHAVFSDD